MSFPRFVSTCIFHMCIPHVYNLSLSLTHTQSQHVDDPFIRLYCTGVSQGITVSTQKLTEYPQSPTIPYPPCSHSPCKLNLPLHTSNLPSLVSLTWRGKLAGETGGAGRQGYGRLHNQAILIRNTNVITTLLGICNVI